MLSLDFLEFHFLYLFGVYTDQRITFGGWCSSSSVWGLGIQLRWIVLVAATCPTGPSCQPHKHVSVSVSVLSIRKGLSASLVYFLPHPHPSHRLREHKIQHQEINPA